MAERVWDRFLTEQDRQIVAISGRVAPPLSLVGRRPAIVSVDNYVWGLGDEPEPILEAAERWPNHTGLAGWDAVGHIRSLMDVARSLGVPVIHVTQILQEETGIPHWGVTSEREKPASRDPEWEQRRRRRYDITPQLAPLPGEPVIHKPGPSAFFGTPLAGVLVQLGVDTIVVVGESTSGCVKATVVDGCTARYRVVVPEECSYDRHEAAHAISLFTMHQKYADVVPVDDVIACLHEAVATRDDAVLTPTR